jgi:fatty acid-binding protein DegV
VISLDILYKKNQIIIVPLAITWEGNNIMMVDIDAGDYFKRLDPDLKLPTTSQRRR